MQGWEFALLLKFAHIKEQLWAIRLRRSFKIKTWENRSRCSLIWPTMSESLSKRAPVSKLLSISLKKRDDSGSLVIRSNCSQKTSNFLNKKTYFSYVLDSFSPFLCLRANRSLQKSNHEWIASFALYKRAAFWSQKRAICLKNQRANSQPCVGDIVPHRATSSPENLHVKSSSTKRRPTFSAASFIHGLFS